MLKIPKGLKKKKKDKKHKRKGEDELFNEEELEKYRKEHQYQSAAADPAQQSSVENATTSTSSTDKGDEWKKFNALTAGIDNILQKTQEDLDRIKSTSFFQRKAPAPPPLPENEKKAAEATDSAEGDKVKKKKGKKVEQDTGDQDTRKEENAGEIRRDQDVDYKEHEEYDVEDEEDEEEPEEEEEFVDDSIFETSYVDAVASGELKLAYIPDSPTKEDDFDPFDTSIADKFIESNPKKRYLNLGCAVQVLSGKTAPSATSVTLERRTPKRRGRPADLLLSSFDEGVDRPVEAVDTVDTFESPVKTLLDDDPTFVESDSTLLPPAPSSVVAPLPAPTTPVNKPVSKLDLSEFEINLATLSVPPLTEQHSVESVDDEFERLAAESLAKKTSISVEAQQPTSIDLLSQVLADSPGAAHLSPISPFVPQDSEPDPFDTSVANNLLLPGKSEIKLLERELLDTRVQLAQLEDDDFDPRAGDPATPPERVIQTPPAPVKPDFLEQSHGEESHTTKPLTPAINSPTVEDYDPFDTSQISSAPGKLELKLIEKELEATDVNDERFDPRSFEQSASSATNPTITDIILNKYNVSVSETEPLSEPAYVDILTGDEKTRDIESGEIPPPVEPDKFADPDDIDDAYADPFDTSIADHIVPGKTELKLLENELIN